MSSPAPNDYKLKVPVSSSIYPRLTREETFSALLDANESRPAHKRFPAEILSLINEELHYVDPIYKKIRSSWSACAPDPYSGGRLLEGLLLDTNMRTFYLPTGQQDRSRRRDKPQLDDSISSADLLYRLRCFFPEVQIDISDGYKTIWIAALRHSQSGSLFQFLEHKGGCQVSVIIGWDGKVHTPTTPETEKTVIANLAADAIQLLNAFYGTIDGKRFTYYHPAADADYPTADERFIAVPNARILERIDDENLMPYRFWYPVTISDAEEDLSSFKSLLPHMKYNIKSREVDLVNGTEDLTTIISSSLLFYRLLCHYYCRNSNINDTPPITSVWQVKLAHRGDGGSIIFMDNRGLFDIRAEDDASTVVNAVIPLVNALLSDECCHPYDGVVAGTIA